jgi:hypothetical protein
MSKLRSEFHDMESVTTTHIETGEVVDGVGRMQVECVFKGRRIVAMYIVVDGERIASRGRKGVEPYDYPAWIPMRDDVVFHDGVDAPGSDVVQ